MARRIVPRNSMSTAAVNVVFTELRHLYPHLLKNARNLLGTPSASKSGAKCGGHHVHFDLKNVLDRVLWNHKQCDAVKLQIHVDGVSLFKSSRAQIWSILGRLTRSKTAVFILGVFSGETKPDSASECFQDSINEMLYLQLQGYYHEGSDNRRALATTGVKANTSTVVGASASTTIGKGVHRDSSKEHGQVLLTLTHSFLDDLTTVTRLENILEELSELPSSDVTVDMEDNERRAMYMYGARSENGK
ncbi:uncharacterized protein DEA37_0011103 [Paragonimus westermani]|uniref:Uncharacterized protein n=1 Tax=Paragonimus westermani TaxID=34504 RepID=A0A5J4N636_9TREM|nr:uncharacterized protein DEA37_0011103 [Paragonimus westermani]